MENGCGAWARLWWVLRSCHTQANPRPQLRCPVPGESMVAFSSTGPANSNEGKFPQPPSAAHTCATAGTQASGPYVTAATKKVEAIEPAAAPRRGSSGLQRAAPARAAPWLKWRFRRFGGAIARPRSTHFFHAVCWPRVIPRTTRVASTRARCKIPRTSPNHMKLGQYAHIMALESHF